MSLLSIIDSLIRISIVEKTLCGYVILLGMIISMFAYKYLADDSGRARFLYRMALITCSTLIMIVADNILLVILALSFSNFLLMQLMIHKPTWQAAKSSGLLAGRYFALVFFMLSCAMLLIYVNYNTLLLSELHHQQNSTIYQPLSIAFLIIAAMVQSSLWPFHKWLLSSLNSPTPVSAMMHAGLINGGGILLIKFAPLLVNTPYFLMIIFYIGLISAIVGTLWKLIQTDIKSILACSTMAQMGFMFMECGLGLFSAALAHICLHGLYKSHLFLGHADLGLDDTKTYHTWDIQAFGLSLIFGSIGLLGFLLVRDDAWFVYDTRLFLSIMAFMLCVHVSYACLHTSRWSMYFKILVGNIGIGALYGGIINLFEGVILPPSMTILQPLTLAHWFGAGFMLFGGLAYIIIPLISKYRAFDYSKWYVRMLNASQPHAQTVTVHRNDYQFKL